MSLKPKARAELVNKLASLEAARVEFAHAAATHSAESVRFAVNYAQARHGEIAKHLDRMGVLLVVVQKNRKRVRRAQRKLRKWATAHGCAERRDVRRAMRAADITLQQEGGAS